MKECREVQRGRLKIYIPKMQETHPDRKSGIRRFEIGERNVTVKEKVVLLVGSSCKVSGFSTNYARFIRRLHICRIR